MTTTAAIASRITSATASPDRQAIDPLLVVALVQALTQIVLACYSQPEDAARYLSQDDLRGRPLMRAIRRRRMGIVIRREWRRANAVSLRSGKTVREVEVVEATLAECERLTTDVVADLYADVRAAKGL